MTTSTKLCPFCNQEKPIEKIRNSHFIPKWVFDVIRKNDKLPKGQWSSLSWVSSGEQRKQINRQDGPHVPFFCEDCEIAFNNWDRPGKLIIDNLKSPASKSNPIVQLDQTAPDFSMTYTQTSGIPYETFKLFILSLVWRCHISPLEAYSQLKLEPSDAIEIHRMLRGGTADHFRKFPIQINRIFLDDQFIQYWASTMRVKNGRSGKPIYIIHMLGYEFMVLSEKITDDMAAMPVWLKPDEPILIPDKNIRDWAYLRDSMKRLKFTMTEKEKFRADKKLRGHKLFMEHLRQGKIRFR